MAWLWLSWRIIEENAIGGSGEKRVCGGVQLGELKRRQSSAVKLYQYAAGGAKYQRL
jgi:hypothetical protein